MRPRALKAAVGRMSESTAPTRGFITGWERDGGILVELSGSGEIVLAQSIVEMSEAELGRSVQARRPVLVGFEDGDHARPVILGVLASLPAASKPEPSPKNRPDAPTISEDMVIVRGRESIELRCGASSITLYKDGKIVLRGTYVISRASKENRIAGGSIHFN